MPIPSNPLKVNIESRVTIPTHRLELGTRHPSAPPWSVPIGTEIDPDLRGNGMKEHIHNHNHRHFAKITEIQ